MTPPLYPRALTAYWSAGVGTSPASATPLPELISPDVRASESASPESLPSLPTRISPSEK